MSLPTPNPSAAFNLGNVYPNAFFDYLSRLLPRKLKVLFKWLEYLYINCGQVFAVIKKFSEYAITSYTYDTQDTKVKERLKMAMEKHLKLKAVDIQIGIDYFVYGNSFTSLFTPFQRWLLCKKCKTRHNAMTYPYEWMHTKFEFKIKCSNPKCKHEGDADVENHTVKNEKKLRVIRWDPKDIDINVNPVTGDTEYYYNIPESIKSKIKTKKPDKFLLNTLPWEFIQTIKQKKTFKFTEGKLYHMKNPAPAGVNQEWGYPSLLGCMKPFFYTAVLRKGNESVALERLVPWRVIYPQPSSSSNDPAQFVNLNRWKNELADAVKKWRRDPNMVKLSPIPIGMQELNSNGRALLVANEIQAAEEVIVTSMGVPKEFIYGGLTHAGGSVTLRMLENLLFTYTDQLNEFNQWLVDQVCEFMNIEKVSIGMTDFKLVDDIQQKQLVGQLFQQQKVSATTFLKSLDIDAEDEREQMIADSVAEAKMAKEMKRRMQDFENSLAEKVDAQVSGNPLQYDPNAVMQVAQQEAQVLAGLDMPSRKQRLAQLKMQDPVLAILAGEMLGNIHKQQRQQGQPVSPQTSSVSSISPEQGGGGSSSTPMAAGG